jgi:NADPH2:quinone reductase
MGRAIFVPRHGDASVLEERDHDPGPPGPGQVRIAIAASGINFIDIYFRSGQYAGTPPFISGLEGAGTIEEVGSGVDLKAGQRVAWSGVAGSYATHVVAPATALVPIPDGVPDDTAAAAMLQGMTAHYLVHGCRETSPGDTALVHAAAGGAGLLLVQTLVAAGARVIATCSTEEKAALAREAGAEEVVLYSQDDFVEPARAFGDGGVDVVYDSVGRTTFEGSLGSLRPRGLLVLFGQSSGAVPPFDPQQLQWAGSVFLTRPTLMNYLAAPGELEMRAGAVLGAILAGDLHIRIGARFPLSEASAAQRALEERRTTGKVLLLP